MNERVLSYNTYLDRYFVNKKNIWFNLKYNI
jgi:hypothetical protein